MTVDPKKRCVELEIIIANAITLIEDGERGSALKMLKTGQVKPTTTTTGVIAQDSNAR